MSFGSFGELWIDDENYKCLKPYQDADEKLKKELDEFVRKGYLVFEGVVPDATINSILADIKGIYSHPKDYILKNKGKYIDPEDLNKLGRADRIVDLYAVSRAAREAIMEPRIVSFLEYIFSEKPIATQSIYFEYGSQQAIHQDTAYVISEKPLSLAACWIALEDIHAGSGELIYYPGSNHFEHFMFSGKYKNYMPERDGQEQHQRFLKSLHEKAKARGITTERLLAKKGDVLMWHAELAHGGSRISNEHTRRSLVAHYVPRSVKATYRKHIENTYFELEHEGRGYFTSRHYDIAPLAEGDAARLIYDGGVTKRRNLARQE